MKKLITEKKTARLHDRNTARPYMKHKKLFENFPPVSTDEWMAKINADLRGADFREKLVWLTREGFEVMPFYREEDLKHLSHVDGLLPLMFRNGEGERNTSDSGRAAAQWLIRQDINVSDYREANLKALDVLMKGVDSL